MSVSDPHPPFEVEAAGVSKADDLGCRRAGDSLKAAIDEVMMTIDLIGRIYEAAAGRRDG